MDHHSSKEFDLKFTKAKSKKSLVFTEIICDFPHADNVTKPLDSLPDESFFLISTFDPWYDDFLLYLQTQRFSMNLSCNENHGIHHHAKSYIILGDTLYCCGVDSILRWCLKHEEVEFTFIDYHSGACGSHLSGMDTTQKILHAGYFWPYIFKDCIESVKKFPPCQVFHHKKHSPPTPLHLVIIVIPFRKSGIDFMQCKPTSSMGFGYIIITIDYFTKWVGAMPTFKNYDETISLFVFNHIITRFGVPQSIVIDHDLTFKIL